MAKRAQKSREELLNLIRSFRGMSKRPGQRPLAEWWAQHKTEERRLEEARDKRLEAMFSNGQRRKR